MAMEPRISISRQAIRQRPSMRALQGGGYEMGGIPTNYAEQAYGKGQHTSPQFGDTALDPVRTPFNQSAVRQSADAQDAAVLRRIRAEEDEERLASTEDPTTMRFRPFARSFREQGGQMQWASSPWRSFFQAMADRGVDDIRTGAAAGMEAPGFFDTQRPSMIGMRDAAHERDVNRLNAADTNRSAANTQNIRRRGY